MSYHDNTLVACNNIQTNLDSAFGAGELVRDDIPAAEAIFSFQHPMRQLTSPGGGKERLVQVTYKQMPTEDNVREVEERGCTATTLPNQLSKIYEMTGPILEVDRYFTVGHLARACEGNGEIFAREIQEMVREMRLKIASQISSEVVQLSGNWGADVTVNGDNALEIATQVSGDWNPEGLVDINLAAREQTGYVGDYIVATNIDMYKYLRMVESGCCAANGLDLRAFYERYGFAGVYDRRMASAMSDVDADAFLINIGAVQVLNYVEAPWTDGTPVGDAFRGSTYTATVFTDPVFGIDMELLVKDECRGKAHVILNAQVQTKGLPNDMFGSSSQFAGVLGVNKIAINNS